MYGVLVSILDDSCQPQEVVVGFDTRDDYIEADLEEVSSRVRSHLNIDAYEEIETIEELGEIGDPDVRYF